MSRVPPRCVALAVLTVADGYALQHRDDLPTIAAPGCWGLFGGSVGDDETPVAAIRREIREELDLDLDLGHWRELWRVLYVVPFWGEPVHHVVFAADITGCWHRHVLGEGQGTGVFPIDALPEPMEPVVIAMLQRYHDQERRSR
jgi:8-oxo-dGTP pyrophosphatase MutT (NUDIX family)